LVFGAAVFRGDERLVSGELVYVFADPATQTSRPVPQPLRDAMQAFEAGEPMVEMRVGAWRELEGDARRVRTEVFIEEQKIPLAMEWDDADASAVHAVAVNRFGRPVATGRLLADAPGIARIGRLAVLRPMRGTRIGRAVLDSLLRAARERGDREAVLNAQVSAEPFYDRAGFARRGAEFDEAGIAHVEMIRSLGD
jgi:predicted GNAT family N-acyltransferase